MDVASEQNQLSQFAGSDLFREVAWCEFKVKVGENVNAHSQFYSVPSAGNQ